MYSLTLARLIITTTTTILLLLLLLLLLLFIHITTATIHCTNYFRVSIIDANITPCIFSRDFYRETLETRGCGRCVRRFFCSYTYLERRIIKVNRAFLFPRAIFTCGWGVVPPRILLRPR